MLSIILPFTNWFPPRVVDTINPQIGTEVVAVVVEVVLDNKP